MQDGPEDPQTIETGTGEQWYAAYTKHQHEKSAASLLEKKGFEILLPLYRTTHRWKDRVQPVALPVFPCYVFIRANLARKLAILQTPGIFWLLGNSGNAAVVPDADIEAIRKIMTSAAAYEPHPYLKSGDRVRVIDGAIAGVEGILTRVKNRYRVVLSVDLLRQALAVEVDISAVERIGPGKPESPAAPRSRSMKA
jgi:transcription antitermination factor NusG